LNASIPAAEAILNSNYDCTVVLDDLFPSSDKEVKRKLEKTLIELIRIVGDNVGRALKIGNAVVTRDPNCGVIATGEYLVGTGSSAARLLPITFITPIDNAKLSECQAEPLVLSTFYAFFLGWYMDNYENIRSWLSRQLMEHRKIHLGVHDRLQETYFHLSSAYKIFLGYCFDKGFITAETAKVQYKSYQNILTKFVMLQDKRVKMSVDDTVEVVDYYQLICTLYKADTFKLADSVKMLKEKHHGFIEDGYLYIRGQKLLDEVLKFAPKATSRDISSALLAQDALMLGSDKRSVRRKTPDGKNTRFYAIPLKKLK
jgi:hypothetical protein